MLLDPVAELYQLISFRPLDVDLFCTKIHGVQMYLNHVGNVVHHDQIEKAIIRRELQMLAFAFDSFHNTSFHNTIVTETDGFGVPGAS